MVTRAVCGHTQSFTAVNNIISHDVIDWLRSVLLEKHILGIIEQLRRQRHSRVFHYSSTVLLLLILTNSKTKHRVCVD